MVGDDYWLGGDEAFWVHQTGDAQAGRAMVGKYVQISESDATENGSYTLRGILTKLFATPELAALESDTRPVEAGEVDGRDAYVLGQEGSGRALGGDRRQRHGAAHRRAGERAGRPRVLGLGAGQDLRRGRRPRTGRRGLSPGPRTVRCGRRPGHAGCAATGGPAATSR